MPIIPRTNDYVEGGRWLSAPGSGLHCGLRALAMAMATDPEVTRPLDWSAGTLEQRYYDALQEVQYQYVGHEDESDVLDHAGLAGIIDGWRRRYKDNYTLYVDKEDDIRRVSGDQDSNEATKTILLRRVGDLWQACCHFAREDNSVDTALADSFADQHSTSQPFAANMSDQSSRSPASASSEKQANIANQVDDTSTITESTAEKLVHTLEELITTIRYMNRTIETRNSSDESLYLVIDRLIVSLDKATQAQTKQSLDKATDNNRSKISTEYDLGLDTPSTVQDDGTAESVSGLDDCDASVVSISPSFTASEDRLMQHLHYFFARIKTQQASGSLIE